MSAWVDEYEAASEERRDKALESQKKKALACIERVEKLLKRRAGAHGKKLDKIQTMKDYVERNKWLPRSFRRMLNSWKKEIEK